MTAAWKLERDGAHLGDDDTDAYLIKFAGWENIAGFISTRERTLPVQITFSANLTTLKTIDYPFSDVSWPIMSKRMIDTLGAVGEFAHRLIPLVMFDDTVDPKDRLDKDGKPRAGVANLDFSAVQITKYTDAFDWERSEYERNELAPDEVFIAKKLVLKDVPLPPLFRLSGLRGPLMVSNAAREALEAAGIKGIRYLPSNKVSF